MPAETIKIDEEVNERAVVCGGDGDATTHALADAVKTRPADVIIESEYSSTTMGVPHAPIHVVMTSPESPEKDGMTVPDGVEDDEVVNGPAVPLKMLA